jgi:hypothetical protein
MEIIVISKANRWSPRVQLGKDRKWERERLKRFKKEKKRKDTVGIRGTWK